MTGLVAQLLRRRMGVLFEAKHCVAMVSPAPAAPGHVWVVPKEEYPILEQTPDFVVAEMFVVANRVAMALFEALGVQGTTMLVQNGTGAGQSLPHAIVHIIPRNENDGLPLQWQPKQLDEESMSTVEIKLKEEAKQVGVFERETAKPVEEKKAEEVKGEDYRMKALRRVP
jgi:histidine triad (HIT) family protein